MEGRREWNGIQMPERLAWFMLLYLPGLMGSMGERGLWEMEERGGRQEGKGIGLIVGIVGYWSWQFGVGWLQATLVGSI